MITSLVIALCLVGVAGCVTTSVLLPMRSATMLAKSDETFRLMTFNIAHGRGMALDQRFVPNSRFRQNLRVIADFLESSEADIVALQEVDLNSTWNGNFDHLSYLQEHAGFEHGAIGVNNQHTGRRIERHYGNGTLAAHHIVEQRNFPFGQAKLGEKGFLYTVLEVDGRAVPLVNLHLDFRQARRRVAQTAQLIAFLDGQRAAQGAAFIAPLIVGDFNDQQGDVDDACAMLLTHLRTFDRYSVEPQGLGTFPSVRANRTIDHVYVPSWLHVVAVQVPEVRLSDHRPVVVDLRFAEGP